MTLLTEKGTFTKTTNTSPPVSQQVNLSNASLTPKIIILHTTGHTALGTFTDDARISYGFSNGTNSACQAYVMDESLETERYTFRDDSIICIIDLASNAIVAQAQISAVAAGSFTLNWTVQSNNQALNIHYEVIGGDDITDVSVVSGSVGNTSTGNHSWNGSGASFIPDFALCMTGSESGVGYNTLSSGGDASLFCIGAAKSTSQRWVAWARDETVGTSDCDMYLNPSACLAACSIANGAITFLADFVSFNNAAGGGITVNVTDGATNANCRVAFLLVKGSATCGFECGAFQQRNGGGTQDVTFANTVLNPSLVFLAGINTANSATVTANAYFCLGASDGTNEGASWSGNQNGQLTFITSHIDVNDKIYRQGAPAATATSSTTVSACDMNDMATVGKFQLNWTTADTTLRRMAWWTVGTLPIYVTQTSIHKYDILANVIGTSIQKYNILNDIAQSSIHKYDIEVVSELGLLLAKVGNLAIRTSIGDQDITTVGFQPKVVIVPSVGSSSIDDASAPNAHSYHSYGFACDNGTSVVCRVIATSLEDNWASGYGSTRNDDTHSQWVMYTGGGSAVTSKITSMLSNGFRNNVDVSNGQGYVYQYLALGGDAIEQCEAGTLTANTTTGQQSVTSLSWKPDVIIFLANNNTLNTTSTNGGQMCIGAGKSSTERACWSAMNEQTADPSDCYSYQRTDRCIALLTQTDGSTVDGEADFVSNNDNGFTIDWVNAPANARPIFWLAIKGPYVKIGSLIQKIGSTGTKEETGIGFPPKAINFIGAGKTASTTSDPDYKLNISVTDGTLDRGIWSVAKDNQATTTLVEYGNRDSCLYMRDNATLANTIAVEADWSAFGEDGFTLDYTTVADSVERQWLYIVFGSKAPSFVTQQSIHKYNILNDIKLDSLHKYNIVNDVALQSIQKYDILVNVTQPSIQKYDIKQDILQTNIHKYNLLHNVIQDTIQKYHILQNVIQSTIQKYDILQNILQSSIQKYHLLQNVLQSNIHKYDIISALENVLQTSIQKYDILNFITGTSTHKYSILQNVLQSTIHKYHVIANVIQNSIHKYDLLQNIISNSIQKYNLLQSILQTSVQKYHLFHNIIQSSIEKYHVLNFTEIADSIHKYNLLQNIIQSTIQKYNVLQNALQASIHKYNLLQDILQSSVHKYNILNDVAQSTIHKYHLLQNIIQNSIHKHHILNFTGISESIHKYNILQNILQSSIHKYHLIQNIISNSIHKYDIIVENIVIAANIAKYNIYQYITETNTHKYNILNTIAQSSIHKYHLLQNAIQSSIHKYHLLQNVIRDNIHKYDLLENIIQNSIHKYNLIQYTIQSSIQKYDILQRIAQTTIQKYNILNDALQTSIHKYNLLNDILQTSTHKYHLFNDVLQSSIHKYHLFQHILSSSIHKYDIIQNIVQTSIQKYDILQAILQSSIHKYHLTNFTEIANSIQKYNLLNSVIQSSIHKYDLIQQIIASSIHKYDILHENIVLVSNIMKYHIYQYITQSNIQKYNILNTIAQSTIQKYNILQNALQSSIQKYDIIASILSSNIHKYNILEYITAPSIQKYNILNTIIQSSIQKYNLLQNVIQDSIHKYDTIQQIIQSSIQKYHILNTIIQLNIHKYDLLNLVSQSSTHKYDIIAILEVLAESIHKYNILKYVTQSSIHKYNVGTLYKKLVSTFGQGKNIELKTAGRILQDFIKGRWPQ